MTLKLHASVFQTLIQYLLRMVRFKKDVIARCLSHKSKCAVYLTVVGLNERVDTAVVIWCWTLGYMGFAW